MTTHGAAATDPSLTDALARLRAAAAEARYPLRVPGAQDAQDAAGQLVARIDDYLVPRLAQRDAPLLVIVGGPTGAGKSTLVNSLVRAPVSAAGVLRPTTRAPLLLCHPDDMPWFSERPLLPGVPRSSGLAAQPDSLRLISAPGLPAGLGLLDAPDVNSVVDNNRALADQLLAAADLWLFVTTAARYADAVPWQVLRGARDRGTAVTLVLNRVPARAEDEVAGDFGALLDTQEMGEAHLFVLPEVQLDGQGLLADRLVSPLRDWLCRFTEDPQARSDVIEQTVTGALATADEALQGLAAAADQQFVAAERLRHEVRAAYDAALAALTEALSGGVLLRGEVLARWRDLVAGRGRQLGDDFTGALTAGLASLIRAVAVGAADRVRTAWQARPEGRALLEGAGARTAQTDLSAPVAQLVRDWTADVGQLAGKAAGESRLLIALALLDGAENAPEALHARPATLDRAARASAGLVERVRRLLATEARRFDALLDEVAAEVASASRLRDLARTM